MNKEKGNAAYYRTKDGKRYAIPTENRVDSFGLEGIKEISRKQEVEILYHDSKRKHIVGGDKGINPVSAMVKETLSPLYGDAHLNVSSNDYKDKEGKRKISNGFSDAGSMSHENPPTDTLMTRTPSGNNLFANITVVREKDGVGAYIDSSYLNSSKILQKKSSLFGLKKSVTYPDGSKAKPVNFQDVVKNSRENNSRSY